MKAPFNVFVLWVKAHRDSLAVAAVVALVTLTTLSNLVMVKVSHAAGSFSIDLSGLLQTASDLFNGLFPVFGPIIGITLAFAIIGFVIAEIRRAI